MVRRQAPASSDGLDSNASNRYRGALAVNVFEVILVFVVVAPGAVFALFALLWLLGWTPSERLLSWITGLTFSACVSGVVALIWKVVSASTVTVSFGTWFAVGT